MRNSVSKKLRGRRGMARAVAILLAAVLVMAAVAAIPIYKTWKGKSDKFACRAALKTAGDSLIIEFLQRMGQSMDVDDARTTLDTTMPGREDICPVGGDIFFIEEERGTYAVVCGLHDPDEYQRTRLNASYVLDELREEVVRLERIDPTLPETVTVISNSRPLECVHVTEETGFRRGTKTTKDYEKAGTVAFLGVAGEGEWEDVDLPAGEICYFCYADENHCAVWRFSDTDDDNDGWSGDSYGDLW